jgi:hypothetical protein
MTEDREEGEEGRSETMGVPEERGNGREEGDSQLPL